MGTQFPREKGRSGRHLLSPPQREMPHRREIPSTLSLGPDFIDTMTKMDIDEDSTASSKIKVFGGDVASSKNPVKLTQPCIVEVPFIQNCVLPVACITRRRSSFLPNSLLEFTSSLEFIVQNGDKTSKRKEQGLREEGDEPWWPWSIRRGNPVSLDESWTGQSKSSQAPAESRWLQVLPCTRRHGGRRLPQWRDSKSHQRV